MTCNYFLKFFKFLQNIKLYIVRTQFAVTENRVRDPYLDRRFKMSSCLLGLLTDTGFTKFFHVKFKTFFTHIKIPQKFKIGVQNSFWPSFGIPAQWRRRALAATLAPTPVVRLGLGDFWLVLTYFGRIPAKKYIRGISWPKDLKENQIYW